MPGDSPVLDTPLAERLAAAEQHLQTGRLEEAEALFQQTLEAEGAHASSLHALGLIAFRRSDFARAIDLIELSLIERPDDSAALAHLAAALQNAGRAEEAAATFEKSLALRPEDTETHNNLGIVLMGQGRLDEALREFEHALALKPDYADAQMNYGAALYQQDRTEEALVRFRRALAADPDHVDTMLKLAAALGAELELEEATALFERVIALKPELGFARIALCMAQVPIVYRDEAEIEPRRAAYRERLLQLCRDYEEGRIPGNLADAVGASQPFYLAYQGFNDRELQTLYGRLMCRAVADAFPPVEMPPPPEPGEKVRVGIVAGLFRHHTVWKLMIRGWLTQFDRRKFEVFAYHTSDAQDEYTGMAQQLCTRFVQGPLPPARWREEIAADAPHVLIYPDIGMDPGAGHLAAHRLAPVQCMSFGHPNTSGYPTIDYFLGSATMEPPDADEHYSERLIRLPNLAFYYEPLAVRTVTIERAALGLPPGSVAYWSGQSLFKYLPQYDEMYARIAKEVPEARFLFIDFMTGRRVTEVLRARLEQAFAAYGLDAAAHCIFLPRLSTEMFVAAIGACDVVLDTPAWSGGNTTLEGLNHGVPIVTWPSGLMRGRVTMAVLQRMGVTETIAGTIDDYVSIAVRLGKDEAWRGTLRRKIARSKHRIYCDPECIAALSEFLRRVAQGEPIDGAAPPHPDSSVPDPKFVR